MALKFSDGYDQYTGTDILRMYTQAYGGFSTSDYLISPGLGRRGTNALAIKASVGGFRGLSRVLTPTGPTAYCGMAFSGITSGGAGWGDLFGIGTGANSINVVPANSGALDVRANYAFSIRNSYYTHLAVSINNNGSLSVLRGHADSAGGAGLQGQDRISQIFGPTDDALQFDQYNYLEFETLIDPTAGSFSLVVNGDVWLDASGVRTQAEGVSSATAWQELCLGANLAASGNLFFLYDDLYCGDTDTSDPLNLLVGLTGDLGINYSNVFQDGSTLDWVPLSGTDHFAMVDEIPPNLDVDYNSSVVAGDIDTLLKTAVPIVGKTVIALVPIYLVRRVSGGNTSSAAVIRDGGTNFSGSKDGTGTAVGNTSTYTYDWWSVTQRPAAPGTALTQANVDAMEVGYEKVT